MENNYINGSDLLLKVAGKAVGHCTSHTVSFSSESKDHAVKPFATNKSTSGGKWKEKAVTGLAISISAEGLRFYGETENGFDEIAPKWGEGSLVDVEAFKRGDDAKPYLKGKFIIASMEESAPAGEDATYSLSLENAGEPEIYPGKVKAE